LLASAAIAVIAFSCWQSFSRFLLPSTQTSQASPDSFWAKASRQDLGFVSRQSSKRRVYATRVPGVYPYSIVPGGLKSAQALRQAAASDKAVARHFSQFDYSRAHLMRLTEPREVYVSYRIRDTVFWTQKRIRLQAGEMLLTDGKITARAKCGNQVSDTAKPEVSNEEPEEDVLDQPVALEPMGPALPIRASLRAPELPAGQPAPPELYAGGFQFPYVPIGLPLPPRNCSVLGAAGAPDCHPKRPPPVPEPSTMILLASGLAGIGWRYRKHKGLAGA
jgi:PEP-CTERM motif